MVYIVQPHDGSIEYLWHLADIPASFPDANIFATLHGASMHPEAAPVTAIFIEPPEAHYDAREAMANNWSTIGLEPVGYHTIIRIGSEA